MPHRVTSASCPSCGMQASRSDRRSWIPVAAADTSDDASDVRRCRNCSAIVDLVGGPSLLIPLG